MIPKKPAPSHSLSTVMPRVRGASSSRHQDAPGPCAARCTGRTGLPACAASDAAGLRRVGGAIGPVDGIDAEHALGAVEQGADAAARGLVAEFLHPVGD